MLTENRHLWYLFYNMTMPQVTRLEVWRRFWKEQGVYVLEHSPYSPDLVPCDFFSSLVSRKILLAEIYLPPKVRCLHIKPP